MAGSQKITLWGPQRTPLGILRVKSACQAGSKDPTLRRLQPCCTLHTLLAVTWNCRLVIWTRTPDYSDLQTRQIKILALREPTVGGIFQQKLYEVWNYLISQRTFVKCQLSFVLKYEKCEMGFCVSSTSRGREKNCDMEFMYSRLTVNGGEGSPSFLRTK
jgi:hypothetical protein